MKRGIPYVTLFGLMSCLISSLEAAPIAYSGQTMLQRVDLSTGSITTIGPYGPNLGMWALETDSRTGELYGIGYVNNNSAASGLYRINKTHGTAQLLGVQLSGTFPAAPTRFDSAWELSVQSSGHTLRERNLWSMDD
jgi:hypothetical protein